MNQFNESNLSISNSYDYYLGTASQVNNSTDTVDNTVDPFSFSNFLLNDWLEPESSEEILQEPDPAEQHLGVTPLSCISDHLEQLLAQRRLDMFMDDSSESPSDSVIQTFVGNESQVTPRHLPPLMSSSTSPLLDDSLQGETSMSVGLYPGRLPSHLLELNIPSNPFALFQESSGFEESQVPEDVVETVSTISSVNDNHPRSLNSILDSVLDNEDQQHLVVDTPQQLDLDGTRSLNPFLNPSFDVNRRQPACANPVQLDIDCCRTNPFLNPSRVFSPVMRNVDINATMNVHNH
jgi:hypothetical protein